MLPARASFHSVSRLTASPSVALFSYPQVPFHSLTIQKSFTPPKKKRSKKNKGEDGSGSASEAEPEEEVAAAAAEPEPVAAKSFPDFDVGNVKVIESTPDHKVSCIQYIFFSLLPRKTRSKADMPLFCSWVLLKQIRSTKCSSI